MASLPLNYTRDASSADWNSALPEFIKSLVSLSPQEAAISLSSRLLAEEAKGQAYFDRMVTQAEQVVSTLQVSTVWRRALQAELILAGEYEVAKPIIPSLPVATPLLEAMTSGKLNRVFDSLMSAPTGLVPLLAEQALREHKVNAADEWEGIRFLDALLHISDQGTRNMDNQHVLCEWGASARIREDQQAQEQLLPERKQVVTEADRPILMQRLHQLSEHWQAASNVEVQAVIHLINNRLVELDAALSSTNDDSTALNIRPSSKLSLRQIALLQVLNHKAAIRQDSRAKRLAEENGHSSGAKLYDHYRKVSKPHGIIGVEGPEIRAMINDIETIIPQVEERYKKDALDKIKVLTAKQQ